MPPDFCSFQENFVYVCNAILKDGVPLGRSTIWCPWSSRNSIEVSLHASAQARVIHGLVKLGVLTKKPASDFASWRTEMERYYKNRRPFNRQHRMLHVYDVADKKRLRELANKPPIKTLHEWEMLFGNKGQQKTDTWSFDQALDLLKKVIRDSPNPSRRYATAINTLSRNLCQVEMKKS